MSTLDLTNTSYSYIVNKDGTVTLTTLCDDVTQTPMIVPDNSSTEAIEAYLTNIYIPAYISGLKQTLAQTPGKDVPVGQQQTVGN